MSVAPASKSNSETNIDNKKGVNTCNTNNNTYRNNKNGNTNNGNDNTNTIRKT